MARLRNCGIFLELHVPDFQKAINFYKLLGFEVLQVWEAYLVMNKGNDLLFFYAGDEEVYQHAYFKNFSKNTRRGYAIEIIIYDNKVQELYKNIKDKVKIVEELVLQEWGEYDFRVEDPFGYYVRVGERHDFFNDKEAFKNTKKIAKKKGLKI
jgi:uncharacterized glyoxalase superfamily protein PhnB